MSLPQLRVPAPRKPRQRLHLDTGLASAAASGYGTYVPSSDSDQALAPPRSHSNAESHGHSRASSVTSIEEQRQNEFNAEVKATMGHHHHHHHHHHGHDGHHQNSGSQQVADGYPDGPVSGHSDGHVDGQAGDNEFVNPNDKHFGHMTENTWLETARQGNIREIRQLGEGSGGSVRLCRLSSVAQTPAFALKEIPANPDPELRKQILRELQFNRLCDSPHIVRYYGAYLVEEVGSIFIAMEFCEGGSLDTILRQVQARGGRIGERVLARIAESVLQGICYLYDRKIIHRDIKPQNILLTLAGEVKLCDFGVSGQVVNSLATTFTGTSYYMAPERIRGQPYTVTSDVWSLGLTLMELALARFPFQCPEGVALTPIELLSQIVNMPAPQLEDEPGIKWSSSFRHFLGCCLEKDLSARPSPQKLLSHPWITGHRSRGVDMAKFVQQCRQ